MARLDMLQRLSETVWELPVTYKEGMQVPARIYGTEQLVREMDDAVYDQVTNVATADIAFRAWGEALEETFVAAAKAVTLHQFTLRQSERGWEASVILDI